MCSFYCVGAGGQSWEIELPTTNPMGFGTGTSHPTNRKHMAFPVGWWGNVHAHKHWHVMWGAGYLQTVLYGIGNT